MKFKRFISCALVLSMLTSALPLASVPAGAADTTLTPSNTSGTLTITLKIKGTPDAPTAPTKSDATKNSVTLTAVDGCEYSKDGETWQESPTFTGLTPGTEYSFYQRKKADDDNNASPASTAAKISTLPDTYALTITLVITEKFSVTYDANGADGTAPTDSSQYEANDSVTVKAAGDLSKTGYSFGGWNTKADGTGTAYAANGTFAITADTTLYAQWTVNQYTITFDTDGGSAVAAITKDYGATVTAPADPTKTGYTFDGWDKTIPTTMPAENTTIKAKWTVNQYTITFDTDGGSAVEAITKDYGATVTAPADPTKTGYTFNGWDKTIPTTMPAENITVKAQWTVNQYTITFDTDGGSAIAAITKDYGATVTAPADPTKEGYTFAGWDKDIPETMPAEDITIKAQWTVNQYTITFDTDGGTTIAPITADYGTEITAPARPTRSGYAFKGWDPIIPSTMPAYDLTVTAQWISTASFTPSVPSSTTTTTTTTTTSSSVDSASSKAKMWAVQNDDKSSITVGWDKVTGATQYTLYVRKNGKLEKVVDTKKTKVLIKNPANNTNLEYVLKYTIGGVESAENSAYTASIKVYYKPAVKATSKNGAVTLKWNKVPEATKYRVYKYVNGKLVKVADTKANAVRISKVTTGKTYKYAVKAYVDGKWTKVTKSDIVSVKVK